MTSLHTAAEKAGYQTRNQPPTASSAAPAVSPVAPAATPPPAGFGGPSAPASQPYFATPAKLGWLGVPVRAWITVGLILAAFCVLYWPNLLRLWRGTNPINGTKEWPHAVFVPIVGLYYLYLHLDDLLRARVRPLLGADFSAGRFISAGAAALVGLFCWLVVPKLPVIPADYANLVSICGVGLVGLSAAVCVMDWGLGSLLFGLFVTAYGIYPGQNDFVWDVGMVLTVFGIVLTIAGWGVMRIAWFPIALLLCALPWPGLFYSRVAMPLQVLAAHVGVFILQISGVEASITGTTMYMTMADGSERPLNVAEACAGIRSLMTFVTLAATMAFVFGSSRPMWQKLFVTFAAVPIAIACNVMRVAGQGLLDRYVSTAFASGFAHQFAGMVMLIPGFLLILGLFWMLDRVFVEEVEDDDEPPKSKPARPKPRTLKPLPVKAGGAA